jgi:rhodanese-related sulfurtransferase
MDYLKIPKESFYLRSTLNRRELKMNKKLSFFLVITFFVLYSSSLVHAVDKTPEQVVREAKASISEVSIDEVKKMIDNREDIILLDVRDSEEYETGHIPGAINISRGRLDFKVHLIIPDKNAKVVVYCGLDLRSPLATKSMNDLGYKKAVNMIGGLKAWKESGYPIVK